MSGPSPLFWDGIRLPNPKTGRVESFLVMRSIELDRGRTRYMRDTDFDMLFAHLGREWCVNTTDHGSGLECLVIRMLDSQFNTLNNVHSSCSPCFITVAVEVLEVLDAVVVTRPPPPPPPTPPPPPPPTPPPTPPPPPQLSASTRMARLRTARPRSIRMSRLTMATILHYEQGPIP